MNTEINYLMLKEHSLFEFLSRENIYQLMEEVVIKRMKRGNLLETWNDHSQQVYFVLKEEDQNPAIK